jgi:chemotaxis protein MotB
VNRATVTRIGRRRHRRDPPPSHDRWLVSYADFITLLFAFFTTMYAISTVDARKLSAVVGSMQAAFATDEADQRTRKPRGPDRDSPPAEPEAETIVPAKPQVVDAGFPPVALPELQAELTELFSVQIREGAVEVLRDPRGLLVSLREAGTFDTGSADLSTAAQSVLRTLAGSLATTGNNVRVEGHTDDVPIHTDRYRSNWELSTARATNVVAFLAGAGVAPGRLSASGYGEFRPRAPNDSGANRTRNRRVDIVILNAVTNAREEPGQASGL